MKGEPSHAGPKGERGELADGDINETIILNYRISYNASTAIQISFVF